MRHAMIVPMLLLSACATTEQQASADLDDSLDAMIGQPVSVALARLGEPIETGALSVWWSVPMA